MASIGDVIVFVFALVQLSAAEYVVYGRLKTIDDSLSLNLNRCHHPLITQLSLGMTCEHFFFQLGKTKIKVDLTYGELFGINCS